jgi:Universal stress protein family
MTSVKGLPTVAHLFASRCMWRPRGMATWKTAVRQRTPIRTWCRHGFYKQFAVPPKLIHRDLCEEAQWKLSALLPAGSPDCFRALVAVGKAADEIVRVARKQKADLIVMGTHGWGALRHLLGSSVAAKVSRKASVPVHHGRCHAWRPSTPLRRSWCSISALR